MVRGLEPGPTAVGVIGRFRNPALDLNRGTDNLERQVQSNDETVIEGTGIPPTNDTEAAIFATREPGDYTLAIRGKNNTIGIARVKIYQLPSR
jgi:hypothetical protein